MRIAGCGLLDFSPTVSVEFEFLPNNEWQALQAPNQISYPDAALNSAILEYNEDRSLVLRAPKSISEEVKEWQRY